MFPMLPTAGLCAGGPKNVPSVFSQNRGANACTYTLLHPHTTTGLCRRHTHSMGLTSGNMEPIYIFALFTLVLTASILAQMLSKIVHIPSIVFLLAAGILLGPEGIGVIDPHIYGDGLRLVVTFAVVIIVFDGGINIDIRHLRTVSHSVLTLVSVGVLITMIGGAVAARMLAGLDWGFAFLFGALVAATGPTVIVPLMQDMRVNNRIRSILEMEGVFNDAVSVLLAAVIFEWITMSHPTVEYGITTFLLRIAIGVTVGLIMGLTCTFALSQTRVITRQLVHLTTMSFVLVTYTIAEMLSRETGILAVAIAAIYMGMADMPYKKEVREFKSYLSIILLSVIFILLAAMLQFDSIASLGVRGVLVIAALILIVRPITVFVSTIHSPLRFNDRLFISAIGPRGVVPASMATYFALKITDGDVGDTIMGLVFLCIIITVILTGVLARPIAKKLKVIPMEILIVGGGGVGSTLAHRMTRRGENVVVIDTDIEHCRRLEKFGIPTVHGDGGDITVLRKAGIKNARYLVATTDQDSVNMLICQVARSKFGFGEGKLIARANDPKNLSTFHDLGIKSMSPIASTAAILDHLIGHPSLFSMYELGDHGDIVEILVTNPEMIGKAIKELKIPINSIIVLIRRGDDTLIPHGDAVIENGDHITIMGKMKSVRKAVDMFR